MASGNKGIIPSDVVTAKLISELLSGPYIHY